MSKRNRKYWQDKNKNVGEESDEQVTKSSGPISSMIKDATSIPFNYASGVRVPIGDNYSTDSYPQMMALFYQPTIGISTSNESPAFIAAKEAWQYNNVNNGRVPDYDPSDLQLYFYAAGNVDLAVTIMRRIYQLCWYYNGENRAVPQMWFDILGVDFDDVSKHLENFRTQLNLIIRKINKTFAIPDGMEFVSRQKRMIEKIFSDEESIKTQLYIFQPVCLYRWDEGSIDPETQEAIPTRLVPQPWYHVEHEMQGVDIYSIPQAGTSANAWSNVSGLRDREWLINWLNRMVEPILNSTDISHMIADMLNADVSMYTIEPITEEAEIEVVKDDSMLSMIENLRIVPQAKQAQFVTGANRFAYVGPYYPVITINNDINKGYAEFTYRSASMRKPEVGPMNSLASFQRECVQRWAIGKTVNMHTDNPTFEEQYLATRWVPHVRYTPQGNEGSYPDGEVEVVSCSTEIIVDAAIYWTRYDSTNMAAPSARKTVYIHVPPMLYNEPSAIENEWTTFNEDNARMLAYLSVFHRHFEMMYTPWDYNNEEYQSMGIAVMTTPYWELDKWGYFQDINLDACHNLSCLVAFNTSLNKKFS